MVKVTAVTTQMKIANCAVCGGGSSSSCSSSRPIGSLESRIGTYLCPSLQNVEQL